MEKVIHIGKKRPEYYKDILIKADLGLHEQIFDVVSQKVPKGSKILDVGAGQGALSQRFIDHGYEVFSLDTDAAQFRCSDAKFTQINFDVEEQFQNYITEHDNFFDCIICIEVIEHVENHWDLSRSIQKMLKTGGSAIFSTPNITSWYSRLYFLFNGKFHQFDKDDLSYGHINPISQFHIDTVLKKTNWTEIEITKGGTLPPIWIGQSIAVFFLNIFALMLRPLQKGILDGWCLIVHAKNK